MKKREDLMKWEDMGNLRDQGRQRNRRKGRFSLPVLVMVLWAAVLLSACSSKSVSTAAGGEAAQETVAAAGYTENTSMDQFMEVSPENGSWDMPAETVSSQSPLSDTGALAASGRKLIRDVTMNVETRDFGSVLSQITDKVSELEGYVESSDVSGISVGASYGGQRRYADMKVRIPADRLDRFIETVESAGNVTSRQEQATDVTLQYADVESRKKSLEIEQERIWALLEKAESLDAVVTLESRLSEIRYQLESYTSQLRLYDNQVDYSTVSIHVVEVKDLTPAAPDGIGTRIQKGFNRSLNRLMETGTGLIVWFAASSPILLVLALMIGAAVLIVRKITRKMRAKKGSRPGLLVSHKDRTGEDPAKKEQTGHDPAEEEKTEKEPVE